MTPEQISTWENNKVRLMTDLMEGADRLTVTKYEVRISLNDDQDIVLFPATLPDRDVTSENDLPVGMVIETFEGARKGDEPQTTKLMGLFADHGVALAVVRDILVRHEVIL